MHRTALPISALLALTVVAQACELGRRPQGPDATSDASARDAKIHSAEVGPLTLTINDRRWDGEIVVRGKDLAFWAEIDLDAELVRAAFSGTKPRIEVELRSESDGQVFIDGVALDGYGPLTEEQRSALESVVSTDLALALGVIPLELGCMLTSDTFPADPRVAALLLPWQLLLKHSNATTVEAIEALASCRYFEGDLSGSSVRPQVLRLSRENAFPNVYAFQLVDEVGGLERACPTCKAKERPCGARCPHACGADCEPNNCKVELCSDRSDIVSRYTCGTHEGCATHDDCYDDCNRLFKCGGFGSGNDTCHRNCDLQCLAVYGNGKVRGWVAVLAAALFRTPVGPAVAAGLGLGALYPCLWWAGGHGPLTGEVVATYRRRPASGEVVPMCRADCGDRICVAEESPAQCPTDCSPDVDGATTDAGVTHDASASNDDVGADCELACGYRADVLRCTDDGNSCVAICLTFRNIAAQQGSCASVALTLEECRYSRAASKLGCTVSDIRIDAEVCAGEASALRMCKAQRDAPMPDPKRSADAGIADASGLAPDASAELTPAVRCEGACAYRLNVLGCAGDPNVCAALCLADRNAAEQEGACASAALALHECHQSQQALQLGCATGEAEVNAQVCSEEAAASQACRRQAAAP